MFCVNFLLDMETLQNYFKQYEASHQHKLNRLFHALGIPLIVISLLAMIFMPAQRIFLSFAWVAFILGWIFQFVGHAFERSWPEFMRNPIFLLIGPLYFLNKIFKKI